MTDRHRFPVLIDADPDNRASDAHYRAKRRLEALRRIARVLAFAAAMIGLALLAALAGKAAANVQHYYHEATR